MCKYYKIDGQGRRVKDPVGVQRRLGKRRRYGRHSVEQEYGETTVGE
jgi:hypothetical protein